MNTLDELTDSFSRLPGIGRKSASRIAYYLLRADRSFLDMFARQLSLLQDKIHPCAECGSYTEDGLCSVCADPLRDRSVICVVEQPRDVQTIEASHEFRGLFHVLGGVIAPLDGIGPAQLSFGKLTERIKINQVSEVIIATNPTVEGDTTALYLQKMLSGADVKVTRLASGLPVGGDLEYADKLTLARSFRGRMEL